MARVTWDVIEFYGQKAQIKLVDNSSGGWGHINFDDLKGDITCGWGEILPLRNTITEQYSIAGELIKILL